MWAKKSVKRSLSLIFILIIGAFLAYAIWPYRNAFFGAFILFIVFRPFYFWLHQTLRWSKGLSASLVIVATLVIVLLPLSVLVSVLVQDSQQTVTAFQEKISQVTVWTASLPQEWQTRLNEELANIVQYSGAFVVDTVKVVGSQVLIYVIMYFLFYYLLVTDEMKLRRIASAITPFSQENTTKLQQEFRNVTHSTIVATGLIAIIQASLLTAAFFIFDIPGALTLGFISLILAFLPVIGIPIIWIPVAILQFFEGNLMAGVSILVWGLFLSTIDNFLRPMIQRKVGAIHPFVSILGVVIGVSAFGLVGVVVGPLLLSFFILMVRMFNEEHVK